MWWHMKHAAYNPKLNKAFRERQHPSVLDQWMNSPFIGHQVGNCKSFTLTHYLADIYLPCTMAQSQSHCASNNISNSHPFHSKWVKPPIPELQQFQHLTWKIQGPDHGWGQSLKSQCESNILSTHIPFVLCQWAIPFLRYEYTTFSKFDLENPRSRSWKRWTLSHNMSPTFYRLTFLLFHVNRPPIHKGRLFQIWPWKSKVKVMGEGKLKVTTWVQHSINSHPFHPMSIGHPIPEIRLFQNLTLKIQGQGHGWGQRWKSQSGCNILSTHIPFVPCQTAIPFLRYDFFKIWPWKSKVKVKWPWGCTTTGLDNSIELQMVLIHPVVSDIRVPQSPAQVLPDLTSFWPMGKPIWGK